MVWNELQDRWSENFVSRWPNVFDYRCHHNARFKFQFVVLFQTAIQERNEDKKTQNYEDTKWVMAAETRPSC